VTKRNAYGIPLFPPLKKLLDKMRKSAGGEPLGIDRKHWYGPRRHSRAPQRARLSDKPGPNFPGPAISKQQVSEVAIQRKKSFSELLNH
jgi:hypothetical protein